MENQDILSNRLMDFLDSSIIHQVSDSCFMYSPNHLHKQIHVPIYFKDDNPRLKGLDFLLDTGAAMTCMSLKDVNDTFGYTEKDYEYAHIHAFSGYNSKNICFMIPIQLPQAIIGGFLFNSVVMYSPFVISITDNDRYKKEVIEKINAEYVKLKKKEYEDTKIDIKYKVDIKMSSALDFTDEHYREAFTKVYKSYVVTKTGTEIDKEGTYDNLHKYFNFRDIYTNLLLGMDMLNYFDVVIVQPRYEITKDETVTDEYSIYVRNKNRYVQHHVIENGKLYLSLPSEAQSHYNTLALENTLSDIGTTFPYSPIENVENLIRYKNIDGNDEYDFDNMIPIVNSYLQLEQNSNSLLFSRVNGIDIFNSLSQNSVKVVNNNAGDIKALDF